MFEQLLSNKNKNAMLQHSAAVLIRDPQFWDLNEPLVICVDLMGRTPWKRHFLAICAALVLTVKVVRPFIQSQATRVEGGMH
jgi:hypothetical protein